MERRDDNSPMSALAGEVARRAFRLARAPLQPAALLAQRTFAGAQYRMASFAARLAARFVPHTLQPPATVLTVLRRLPLHDPHPASLDLRHRPGAQLDPTLRRTPLNTRTEARR